MDFLCGGFNGKKIPFPGSYSKKYSYRGKAYVDDPKREIHLSRHARGSRQIPSKKRGIPKGKIEGGARGGDLGDTSKWRRLREKKRLSGLYILLQKSQKKGLAAILKLAEKHVQTQGARTNAVCHLGGEIETRPGARAERGRFHSQSDFESRRT